MNIIGRAPIDPVIFYTGKLTGYTVWGVWVLSATGVADFTVLAVHILQQFSFITFGAGLILVIFSLINLGKSTRLGLPDEDTELQTNGLYRFSRHPMYLGFHLFTLSAMLLTLNPFVIFGGAYSVVVYHYIIKAEEQFLDQRFAQAYENYKQQVRRYL
ncbi:MAG: isoprenylcysteine carboxylmethyltransferase family protein [Halieaceae bacterium]